MYPLEGLRIISVEQYGAGPYGTMMLADMGAEVIKVENPAEGGDVARGVGPFFLEDGDSQFYQSFNRNKRSITLNLKSDEGREVFHDLVRGAEAVFNNLRGDQPARLGLDYASLKDVNPAIICTHLSAYGRHGSRAAWPGYDYLIEGEAGYLTLTGEPDTSPSRFGLPMVDFSTGIVAALSLVSGVMGARVSGEGRDMDASLFDVGLHNLCYIATWYLNGGHVQGREERSGHPSICPSQLFRTEDGWIFIMCNKEKFWPLFCDLIGKPEWGEDARFRTSKERFSRKAELTQLVDAVMMEKTTDVWMEILQGKVPSGPVYDVGRALDTDYVAEMGNVQPFDHPADPDFRMLVSPIRISDAPPRAHLGPTLGADTGEVLAGMGYEPERIQALRDKGAI